MEALLSNFSALLTFLQQHFIPSFLFWLLNVFMLLPALTERGMMVDPLPPALVDRLGLAAIFALALGYALDNFNTGIIELYQGYPFAGRRWGRWLTARQKARRRQLVDHVADLKRQVGQLEAEIAQYPIGDPERERLFQRLTILREQLDTDGPFYMRQLGVLFPTASLQLLPTKLGNIIEAFKDYPFVRYGIDGALMLEKLQPILVKNGYDAIVRQEKLRVDFFLDASLLSLVFMAECLISALLQLIYGRFVNVMFLMVAILSTIFARWFYQLAAAGAIRWGSAIRSAFDLYRYDLLRTLYGRKPYSMEDEKKIWTELSAFMRQDSPTDADTVNLDYVRIRKELRQSAGDDSKGEK